MKGFLIFLLIVGAIAGAAYLLVDQEQQRQVDEYLIKARTTVTAELETARASLASEIDKLEKSGIVTEAQRTAKAKAELALTSLSTFMADRKEDWDALGKKFDEAILAKLRNESTEAVQEAEAVTREVQEIAIDAPATEGPDRP